MFGAMKRTNKCAALLALVLLLSAVAQESPEDNDGYMLRRDLHVMDQPPSNAGDGMKGAFALGYVLGISEALDGVRFCMPAHWRAGEIHDVVIKYLDDHPEQLHKARVEVTESALQRAFPCPTTKR
jgi:hypothetical protein